jgi:hypothetical protein
MGSRTSKRQDESVSPLSSQNKVSDKVATPVTPSVPAGVRPSLPKDMREVMQQYKDGFILEANLDSWITFFTPKPVVQVHVKREAGYTSKPGRSGCISTYGMGRFPHNVFPNHLKGFFGTTDAEKFAKDTAAYSILKCAADWVGKEYAGTDSTGSYTVTLQWEKPAKKG